MINFRRLTVLACCLTLVGLTATAEGGPFRHRRRCCQPSKGCAPAPGYPPAPAPSTCQNGTICPVYMWMNHGTYQSWYSIKCGFGPCNWDGQRTTPASEACVGACAGCEPVQFVGISYTDRKSPHHVDTKLAKKGSPAKNAKYELQAEAKELLRKKVKFRPKPGDPLVVAEIVKANVRGEVFLAGHEVPDAPTPDMPEFIVHAANEHVFVIKEKAASPEHFVIVAEVAARVLADAP